MAVQFQEDVGQSLLKIGDTVLLYAKEAKGYVFSELTSERHNSVALCKVASMKDPGLANIHFAAFTIVRANKFKAQERYTNYQHSLRGRELSANEKSKVQQYERDLVLEDTENRTEQERLKGSNIVYGERLQLLHSLTGKYLTVNTTRISRTENTNLKVELSADNAAGCVFKILPRYKVRSVGDEVRYNDQVKFESLKTEGQFLHCSTLQYGDRFPVLSDSRELNLSATESAFTLVSQYRPTSDQPDNAFRGGEVVRLFHREYECYVSAEGSFAEQKYPVIEDVHCRKRHSDRGRLKEPSTSANVYWQFEKDSDPRSGEPLYWGERVRIKHLPTRLYLTVTPHQELGYTVGLKSRVGGTMEDDLDTMFSLSPVIREGDTILTESYARIKHLQTSTWLHLERALSYVRRAFNPEAPGLEGLEWDSAELFTLSATETMNYDDAFTLESVGADLVHKFNHVAGIVPVLTTHLSLYRGPSPPLLDRREAYLVESALGNLADYLDDPSPRETKNRQKLLRNLRVLELIIDILGLFKLEAKDAEAQRTVCKGCYNVIKSYLNGDSRKNENYLARFIPFFKKQVNCGLNAEEVMIEMVEDNSGIVSRVAATELGYMIDQLVSQKDPRFMEFLGNLCVCAGRPIPMTQKAILSNLVSAHGEEVFYRLSVGTSAQRPDASPSAIYMQAPGSKEWRDLTELAGKGEEASSECEFLESQLSLFARLCKGNNAYAICSLGQDELHWVDFDLVLSCAAHPLLRPSLRSKFVELMIVMFVDVGNNRNVLENLSLSFVYDDVVEDPYKDTGTADTIAFTGEENVHFPAMRDWLLEHLSATARDGLVAECVEDNVLLADVLSVLKQLVVYGYYDDGDDVNSVLEPLTAVLSGFSDKPFKTEQGRKTAVIENAEKLFADSARFLETEENKPIFQVKKKCMEVIDLFLNFRFYIRLQRFIYDFRVLKGSCNESAEGLPLTGVARVPASDESEPPSLGLERLLSSTPAQLLDPANSIVVGLARERLAYLFSLTEYYIESGAFSAAHRLKFPELLLDLAMYESDQLIQESLHLLNRFYSAEISLFNKAIQTELLVTPDSVQAFNVIRTELPDLRRNMGIDAGSTERASIIRTLQHFSSMCILGGDETLPHQQNQRILYNYGVLSDVINYVLQMSKNVSMEMSMGSGDLSDRDSVRSVRRTMRAGLGLPGATDIPAVFAECFIFLKALARANLTVQRRIYERMDDLLEIDIAVPAIGELLTEAFTGGSEICLKVTESQVERLFHLIAHDGVEGRPELILTLQAMAKVEDLDLPVKRNQAFIIKYFSKTRDKFCDHILGESKLTERRALLSGSPPQDPDLMLLLAMTDLLASCAEGENLFIESVCQKVFAIEELLGILNNAALPCERKRPFARFLVAVYMNTAGDKHSSGAAQLDESEAMWGYLEVAGNLLLNVSVALRNIPPGEAVRVRQSMSSSSRTYSHSSPGSRRLVRTNSRNLDMVTGEDGNLLPDVLLYLTDGILPLLLSFYDDFYATGGSQHHQDITGRLLRALLALCTPLTTHISTDAQMRLYRKTVLTLLAKGASQTIDTASLASFDARTKSCQALETPIMSEYQQTYAQEVELNKAFNSFVTNFRLSYQGPDDARAQVGSKFPNPYSNFLDEECAEPGDEYLPLGPSFQDHVHCFLGNGEVRPCVERLIKQLEISFNNLETLSESERTKQDSLDIKCLQILRAIIHNEIVCIDPYLKENSASGYRKRCVTRVQPLQNAIQDFDNAVSRVVPMLSHPNDSIVSEVLAFLKVIFYSGNRHVQEGMKHLLETREERLFSTVQGLLQNAAVTFNERQALLAQVDARVSADSFLSSEPLALATGVAVRQAPPTRPPLASFITIDIDDGEAPPPDMPAVETRGLEMSFGSTSALPLMKPADSVSLSSRRASSKQVGEVFELKTLSALKDGTIKPEEHPPVDQETLELLSFKDSHHVKLALRVLGLMCDGQYRLMQNYLREQRDNIATINLVGEVALFLQHFYTEINPETMDLVHLILQTLIEMCVGNYPNQVVIFNRQIVEALNHILAIDIADRERAHYNYENGINLKGSAIELLEAMLEETDKDTRSLVGEIAGSLDIGALHDTIVDFRTLMLDRTVQDGCYDDEAETGLLRTYHVLVHLTDYGIAQETIQPVEEEGGALWEAWSWCRKQSNSIEVFYKNMNGEKILTKVHFPFNPDHELREEVVEKVKWNICRDSPEDKLRDFLEWMKAVKKDTVHQTKLHKFPPTRFLTSFPEARHYLLILWTLLMNILLLVSFVVPTVGQIPVPYDLDEDPDVGNNSLYTLLEVAGAIKPGVLPWLPEVAFRVLLYTGGAIHLIMSLWFAVEYFVVNFPNFRAPWFVYQLLSRWREAPEETYSDVKVFGLMTVYVVLFLACSILSLAFSGYFYCLCLLHVVINNDILQRVLRSVTKNGLALIWVAILGLIVLFIYSVVSFAFLSESFNADNNSDGDLFCNTLYECFVSTIRYGLVENLGLFVPLVPTQFEVSAIRLLYDISFFIIVTTIILNLVFGIIVDTFSELRDERFRTEQDKKAVCFICGLPSHEFERKAQGFEHHVTNDHNMWKYIYYSIYLDSIDTSDHNAIQSFVYRKIMSKQLDFFPLLEALALGKDEDHTSQKLDDLTEMVTSVLSRFKKEDHERSRRSKLDDQKRWEDTHLRKEGSYRGSVDVQSSLTLRELSRIQSSTDSPPPGEH